MSTFQAVPATEQWPKSRARFLFRQRRERAHDDDVQLTASQAYGVIAQSRYNELSESRATAALAGTENFLHVEKDDFVISLRTFEGGIERARQSGCISPAYTVMRSSDRVEPSFFQYLLKSSAFIQTLQTAVTGIRDGKSVRYEQFADLLLPSPDRDTQKAIADFLDRETARIDQLIEKKQRLIALVDEKRSTLISAAVTGQIGPDTDRLRAEGAPSQDREASVSRPGSSYRVKLKWLPTRTNAGEVIDKSFWGEGSETLYTCARHPFASDFKGFPTWKRTGYDDILLTRNGTPYIHIPEPNSIYSNVVQRVSLPGKNRRYVRYALEAEVVEFRGYGVSIESLNYSMWGNLEILLHDTDYQKWVVDFLDRETAKLERLKEKTTASIDRLREFRSALITAAVTGQIDVSTWGKQGRTDRRLDEIEEAMSA